jgi:hypothetical protein
MISFGTAQAQNQSGEPDKDHSFNSLKKSLIIPGWGQFAEKRYIEGVLFLSSEVFSLYKIFANNHRANINYRLYKDADNIDDAVRYRELTEKYDKNRNIYILAAVGIWAINLVDTYVIVKNKEKKKLKVKLENHDDKKLAIAIIYYF